mmetsp:Transcript_33739/g.49206  ORF Transcript_33739/g.49206 Transcript_33739/m.49206 type:complete len:97 (-) Transcript_33739:779-1069(-)
MEEVDFLTNMNTTLESNKVGMKVCIQEARKEQEDAKEMLYKCLPPLEEKVQVLMLQLEQGGDGSSGGPTTTSSSAGCYKEEEVKVEEDCKPAARQL